MNTEQKEDAGFSAALPVIHLSINILGFTVHYNMWMSSKKKNVLLMLQLMTR